MKRTKHTSRGLVTALVVALAIAAVPTTASADDRPAPAFRTAVLSVTVERPAPAHSHIQAGRAMADTTPAPGDGPHQGLISRPAPAYNLAARETSVVDPPRHETTFPRAAQEVLAAPVVPTAETGFDWLAAAIGIGIGIGVAALAGMALRVGRRRTPQGI